MNKAAIYNRFIEVINPERVQLDAKMKELISFKAGGCSDILVSPSNEEELAKVLNILKDEKCNYFLMGNGSNFLIRDGGFHGVILRIGQDFNSISVKENILTAGSGALLSAVAREAADHSLTGFEFACGIPGSIGGAVAMNAGAYDGELKDVILDVKAMDLEGNIHIIDHDALHLGYRHSVFHENGWIALETRLKLAHGNMDEIKAKMKDLNQRRNEKQPVNYPSAGSFFKRPVGYFAGKLIQDANLKGLSVGGAQVSALHSGFIINTGTATATDIINLMVIVQNTVKDKFGVMLEPEVRIIGEEG